MTDLTDLARIWASLPGFETVRASGDGTWAYWAWTGRHETAEIYAAPTDGSAPPLRLTHGTDHFAIRDVTRDGNHLILAQSRHSCEHDQLFLLDRTAGNRLTELTPLQTNHYLYGGNFAPDGASFCFIADFDYDTGRVTAGGWVYAQELATGARKVLIRTSEPFETGPVHSHSGGHLLWHRHTRAPGGTQLWLIDADGGNPRELLCFSAKSSVIGRWLDNDCIAFIHLTEGTDRDRVGLLTLASGAIRWLADAPGFNPQDIVAGRNGLFACQVYDHSSLAPVVFDAATGVHQPLPNTSGRRSLLPLAGLPDGGWLAEAYDADAPHALVRIHPDGSNTILACAPPLPGRGFARPGDFRWTAPDGTACQGWLYQPVTTSKGLIVVVHGGPTWHSEDWVNPMIGFWVQAGYTVLDPNYRGSTGFGAAYREAVKEDGWGGREQGDIRAGIEALVAQGIAQMGRIAVAGNSYGGFSAWYAITRFADLVNAAIPMCGMYRLDIDYHATEMPHGRAYSEAMMGGAPAEFPGKYANASPGNFIHQLKGRLLIVHGLADSNVGPENTHTAVRELTAAGIPHEVLLFENEGHGVARQSNLAIYLARTADFLDRAFGAPGHG